MLRNDLITLLAENDNNAVTVDVNGALVDIESVAAHDGSIVLVLDPEDLLDTFKNLGG